MSTLTVGDAVLTSINGAGYARNYLSNGDMQVASRGVSFTSGANNDDVYTLDQWVLLSDGNDVVDVTQNTAQAPTNQKYCMALDVETANKKFGVLQIIENKDCYGLIGDTVTFSFKAKVSATTNLDNIKAAIITWSGTADSVTSDVVSAWAVEGTNPTLATNWTYENTPSDLNVTTSWATYSVSAAVDTSSAANVAVFIWSDVTTVSAGEFLYITDCQLEQGSTASTYSRQPYSSELARCQRYFFSVTGDNNDDTYFPGTAVTADYVAFGINFPQPMRATPTFTGSSTNVRFYTNDNSNNFTATNLSVRGAMTQSDPTGVMLIYGSAGGMTANSGGLLQFQADSGYLYFSAEL